MKALGYWLALLTPGSAAVGIALGGAWTFLTPVSLYLIIPALDAALGRDLRDPPAVRSALAFDLPLRLTALAQLALVAWALWVVSTMPLATLEVIGLTLSVRLSSGAAGIIIAHELMHRRGRLDRALAYVLMGAASYAHFCIEHVHGHHRAVATSRDPATARFGESLYAFVARSVVGGFLGAWRIEVARLARRRLSPAHRRNRMLWIVAAEVALYAVVLAVLGWPAVALLAAQSLIAIEQLETVNYIEHYGLVRRDLGDGRLERAGPQHSWNSDHRLGRWFLFELPRHADHHLAPANPYHALRHHDESPELPVGYGAMAALALAPPLWRRLMDPRVEAWRRRHT